MTFPSHQNDVNKFIDKARELRTNIVHCSHEVSLQTLQQLLDLAEPLITDARRWGIHIDGLQIAEEKSKDWKPEARSLIKERKYIEAVRVCRMACGIGLREAKDMVDNLRAQEGL